jgi:hypothetical protein
VPDHVQALRVAVCDNGELRVALDAVAGIDQLAVDLAGQKDFTEPSGSLMFGKMLVGAIGLEPTTPTMSR